MQILATISAFLALVLLAAPASAGDDRPLLVGGGEARGLYFPEAGAICRMVNRERSKAEPTCAVLPTAGSQANLKALADGEAQLAIVQSHILEMALDGKPPGGPGGSLRSLVSLHGEAIGLLALPDSRIKSGADLKGKRVNLGKPGSYQRLMADALLDAEGIKPDQLGAALEMESEEAGKALCDKRIDAAILTGLHPMPEIEEASEVCDAVLVPLQDPAIDGWLGRHKAFVGLSIPGGIYGEKGWVPSFGLDAVLVTTTALPDAEAYAVVKAVAGGLDAFKSLHPMLKDLDARHMANDGLVAPLHEGALKYFHEQGLK